MLVLNAGIFPASRRIEALPLAEWRRVMGVNLDANLALLRAAHPLLKCAPRGGRVVVIGSKNVPAPGPGAAAYSASKAALTQLARVAALEWGADGIRVNVVHPNAVFDTGIWTDDVLRTRAASYGLSVDAYKKNNVLGVEVTSRDVAELAPRCAARCSPRPPAPRCRSTAATTASSDRRACSSGNAARDAEPFRGWFVGHFVPSELGLRSTDAVEVKWGTHALGDTRARVGRRARGDDAEPARVRAAFGSCFADGDEALARPSPATMLSGRPALPIAGRSSRTTPSSLTVRWPLAAATWSS